MINTAIVYDHRGRTKKGCEGPLEVRITINRKPYYINTGVHVRKDEWKFSTIVNRPDAPELNERLRIIAKKVENEINSAMASGSAIDVAEIRRRLIEADTKAKDDSFLEWVENEVSTMVIADGTRKHYVTLVRRLYEFGKVRNWQDLTVENIYEFNKWLHQLKKPQTESQRLQGLEPETISDAAVHNYHKCLKKLLYLALKLGIIDKNPYAQLKGEFPRGDNPSTEYLTEEEINKLLSLELKDGSHLATIRDLAIVQIFTGMAYADLMSFDINDYKEVDGRWIAVSERIKTGEAFIGQLMQPVVDVLERYGWKLPKMSNQKYNEGLKELGKLAGITTILHSHLFRHTFGTLMLSKGVKLENLKMMMGHTDIKMTLRYAKVLAKDVRDDFDKINAEFCKGK